MRMVVARDRAMMIQYQYALGETMYLLKVRSGRVFGCFRAIFPWLCSFMIVSRIFCLGMGCFDWTSSMSCSTVSGFLSFTICVMCWSIVGDLECFLDKLFSSLELLKI